MRFSGRLTSLVLIASLSPPALAAQDLPNVVIVYADDLGYGDLSGFGGHQSSQTPHLDGMVKGARRLSRADCSAF